MTIKDLYEWAKEKGIEDYEIQIQWRDGGGYYSGKNLCVQEDIEINYPAEEIIL